MMYTHNKYIHSISSAVIDAAWRRKMDIYTHVISLISQTFRLKSFYRKVFEKGNMYLNG